MNALVNSQQVALDKMGAAYKERTGTELPVTYARYTGQESLERKQQLQQHPPHILLANYIMLELMMVRPNERVFVDRTSASIQFLVADELHSYRGRQGADVAMLFRRIRERSGNSRLQCIGTSATMASRGGKSERRAEVAAFATGFFGVQLEPEDVIEEALRPHFPRDVAPDGDDLRSAVLAPLPEPTVEALASSPLAWWVETTFGLRKEHDGQLRRQVPLMLSEGARRLADQTGLDQAACSERLRDLLLLGDGVRLPDGSAVFAFKMGTFPMVRRKDEAAHGEYRTKRVVLEMHDDMATAIAGGPPYRTRLEPAPADPSMAHDPAAQPQ